MSSLEARMSSLLEIVTLVVNGPPADDAMSDADLAGTLTQTNPNPDSLICAPKMSSPFRCFWLMASKGPNRSLQEVVAV
eukprot:scaffold157630_cov38-Prasinocladus_malaysianus.AAC.1